MLDPFTAIALASAVVQFADFSIELLSDAHSLYESVSGATAEHLELEDLAHDLQLRADEATITIPTNTVLTREDKVLLNLGKQCREVSDELISVLNSLKVKEGSHKRFKSFYVALKGVWKEDKIKGLQQRLDRIGSIMRDEILNGLQVRALDTLDDLQAQNKKLEAARERDIITLQEAIKENANQISKQIREKTLHEDAISKALTLLSLSTQKSTEYSAEQRILDFLQYDDMEYRHTTLRSAHEKTFSWIFGGITSKNDNSPSNFVDWLRSDDNLFWISGKIGSGKSTLMKFLCDHELVKANLRSWSDGSQLVITSFFFWNASKSDLPKSKEGLLRSILYQILRKAPDLIQYAPPGPWHTYASRNVGNHELGQNFLTAPELLAAFERISAHLGTAKIKFCFFVDGLDEYVGKPDEIIPLVSSLKASPHVKMCVSSRRWNHFEKAFGQDGSRKLYIENYTKNDIILYVRETLENNPDYQEIMEDDESSIDLVQEIVDSAQGVFLWVYLVVRSLLNGIMEGDRLVHLKSSLNKLPSDLEELFEHILFSTIDLDSYKTDTAHMFLVTLAAHDTLPLMSYWFIDQKGPEVVKRLEIKPTTVQQIKKRLGNMEKRVSACTKGLLEVRFFDSDNNDDASLSSSVLFNWKVDFLHRTARDFLINPRVRAKLEEWAGCDFDVNFTISEAILSQIKTAPQERLYFENGGPIEKLRETFYYHAELVVADRRVPLMGELRRTIIQHESLREGLEAGMTKLRF